MEEIAKLLLKKGKKRKGILVTLEKEKRIGSLKYR